MGSRYTEVKAIFDLAVETQSPSERTTYVQRACGGDDQLCAGVEALLKAHAEADGFLTRLAVAWVSSVDALYPTEGPGTVIGRYALGVEKPPRTMDVHVHRINRQATDVDVHRTKLLLPEPSVATLT